MVKKTQKKRAVIRETPVSPPPASIFTPDALALVQLEDHFKLCRSYGVVHWDGPVLGVGLAVKFTLASQLASAPESMSPSSREAAPAPTISSGSKSEPAVGADGLSADMQEELLGRVMDAKR